MLRTRNCKQKKKSHKGRLSLPSLVRFFQHNPRIGLKIQRLVISRSKIRTSCEFPLSIFSNPCFAYFFVNFLNFVGFVNQNSINFIVLLSRGYVVLQCDFLAIWGLVL